MNKFVLPFLGMGLVACSNVDDKAVVLPEAETVALENQARGLVKSFAGQLKPSLKKAIAEGGLSNAVEVCSTKAPAIAADISQESGWQLKRVSLKPRNSESAIADDWEQKILKEFDQQAAEDAAAVLEKSTVSGGEFRFMKAQKVQGLCLACHGSNISAEAKEALAKHYPGDTATGYSLGQVRGAFSLRKSL